MQITTLHVMTQCKTFPHSQVASERKGENLRVVGPRCDAEENRRRESKGGSGESCEGSASSGALSKGEYLIVASYALLQERQAQVEKAIEDAKWVDNDKHVMRKQRRKVHSYNTDVRHALHSCQEGREQKALEAAARKAELRQLAEEEMAAAVYEAASKAPQTPARVMPYQLEVREEQLETEEEMDEEERKCAFLKRHLPSTTMPLQCYDRRLSSSITESHSKRI